MLYSYYVYNVKSAVSCIKKSLRDSTLSICLQQESEMDNTLKFVMQSAQGVKCVCSNYSIIMTNGKHGPTDYN